MGLESPPGNELNKILGICNQVGKEYDQPPLYELASSMEPEVSPPSKRRKLQQPTKNKSPVPAVDEKFHVSIAWKLTPPDQELLDMTSSTEKSEFFEVKKLHIEVREIKMKIGNVVTSVGLPEKVTIEKTLF